MHLGIPRIIQGRLTNPHPVDLQAAQMCLPFSVAVAAKIPLKPGAVATVAVADYEAGLSDKSLYALEDRTTIALDDEVEAASNELSTAARVERRAARRSQILDAGAGAERKPVAAVHRRRARGALHAGALDTHLRAGLRRDHRHGEGLRPARPAPALRDAQRRLNSLLRAPAKTIGLPEEPPEFSFGRFLASRFTSRHVSNSV